METPQKVEKGKTNRQVLFLKPPAGPSEGFLSWTVRAQGRLQHYREWAKERLGGAAYQTTTKNCADEFLCMTEMHDIVNCLIQKDHHGSSKMVVVVDHLGLADELFNSICLFFERASC